MVQVTSCQETRKTVLTAIEKLMRHTAWTSRTIIKFIRREFNVTDPNVGSKISRALKQGVKRGLLTYDNGRYRLNPIPSPKPSNTTGNGPKSTKRQHSRIQKHKSKRELVGQTCEGLKRFPKFYSKQL